ncbi:amidohydrolase family protein [Rubritalea tangerina]|uniref:Amidohydrolase family protein n=1 Tax=Rubritalea tangerina TaxID=430798 RepID=A0ABW4ZCW8_9BACT
MGQSLRKVDCHVHIVGDGSSGSGAWFELPTPYKRLLGRMMIRGIGLEQSTLQWGLDAAYVENLAKQVRESDLDAVVVLAQDIAYRADGIALEDDAQFYVPNGYVSELAKKYAEFIPACSIHPARLDAMDELERCIEAGMPVLKLLPNCLNIDYDDERYLPFWERMAEAGMVLLSHTGGEMTVKVYDPNYGDPKKLKSVLECGVTVIAAHSAGRSGLFDPDWTEDLIQMFSVYPRLYADNSALCSPNRARTLKHILPAEVQGRILHGSDYPVPISGLGPWACGHLEWRDWFRIAREKNVLQRDYLYKRAMGFGSDCFTRFDSILRQASI